MSKIEKEWNCNKLFNNQYNKSSVSANNEIEIVLRTKRQYAARAVTWMPTEHVGCLELIGWRARGNLEASRNARASPTTVVSRRPTARRQSRAGRCQDRMCIFLFPWWRRFGYRRGYVYARLKNNAYIFAPVILKIVAHQMSAHLSRDVSTVFEGSRKHSFGKRFSQ